MGQDERDPAETSSIKAANLATLLNVLRESIQREDGIADRVDAKTRQLLALVGIIYAIVQTVAFGSYRQGHLDGSERLWIAISALAALVALIMAIFASFRQQQPVQILEIKLEDLADRIDHADSDDFLDRLCRDHLTMLYSRRDANAMRRERFKRATLAAGLAVALIGAELAMAVIARIS
jgi:hypothetical protein